MNTIIARYKNSFAVLKKRPIMLWGLSLMNVLLTALASFACPTLPIVSIPIALTLEASMEMLYLSGLRGKEVKSEDLFTGFSNFKRVAGGMAWKELWVFIWALIPIVGFVFAIIKSYEYRFTAYILMTRPEISATEAIKESQRMTKGIKGKMFWNDVLIFAAYFIAALVIGLFAAIPYIGILFAIILFIMSLVFFAFIPIFLGLIRADYYQDATNVTSVTAE